MIPYGHQHIERDDINAVIKVLQSDWLTQGPKVSEFESKLAAYCGAKFAVAVNNGTMALHLAYLAAGLKLDDEVITTPNTFVATSNMLLAVGAKPVFCDIRPDTYNIDEKQIAKLITKKTKAIVPVHFAGQPCAMDEILKIAKKYKLLVIEDACHALGAKYKNRKIGSLKSAMTVFSFHPVKPITTAEGGVIVTNNKAYYEKMLILRNHGVFKDRLGNNVMIDLGYNYRMNDLQAALGVSQLKKIDRFIRQRRQVYARYEKYLRGVPAVIRPIESAGNYNGWHIYVIIVADNLRDKLRQYLKASGIGVNFHYPAVYSHPYYKKIGYRRTRLKTEEIYSSTCVTLPCYPDLSEKQIAYICRQIKNFFHTNG